MFTGIIQSIGKITRIEADNQDCSLYFDCTKLAEKGIALGDSVAVNGCCLTVVERNGPNLKADVSRETLKRTALGEYQIGTLVNLELAMLPHTRFGGHFVSGHVDGTAQVTAIEQQGRSRRLGFKIEGYGGYIAEKGSISIDGVSLTVNEIRDEPGFTYFGVNVVPHTLEATIIGGYEAGTTVNIEVDIIARYLERLNQYALYTNVDSSR